MAIFLGQGETEVPRRLESFFSNPKVHTGTAIIFETVRRRSSNVQNKLNFREVELGIARIWTNRLVCAHHLGDYLKHILADVVYLGIRPPTYS